MHLAHTCNAAETHRIYRLRHNKPTLLSRGLSTSKQDKKSIMFQWMRTFLIVVGWYFPISAKWRTTTRKVSDQIKVLQEVSFFDMWERFLPEKGLARF